MIFDIDIFGHAYIVFLINEDGITFIVSLGKNAVVGFKNGMTSAKKQGVLL